VMLSTSSVRCSVPNAGRSGGEGPPARSRWQVGRTPGCVVDGEPAAGRVSEKRRQRSGQVDNQSSAVGPCAGTGRNEIDKHDPQQANEAGERALASGARYQRVTEFEDFRGWPEDTAKAQGLVARVRSVVQCSKTRSRACEMSMNANG